MALRARKGQFILRERNRKFANWTGENVEQVFGDHVVTFLWSEYFTLVLLRWVMSLRTSQ